MTPPKPSDHKESGDPPPPPGPGREDADELAELDSGDPPPPPGPGREDTDTDDSNKR